MKKKQTMRAVWMFLFYANARHVQTRR